MASSSKDGVTAGPSSSFRRNRKSANPKKLLTGTPTGGTGEQSVSQPMDTEDSLTSWYNDEASKDSAAQSVDSQATGSSGLKKEDKVVAISAKNPFVITNIPPEWDVESYGQLLDDILSRSQDTVLREHGKELIISLITTLNQISMDLAPTYDLMYKTADINTKLAFEIEEKKKKFSNMWQKHFERETNIGRAKVKHMMTTYLGTLLNTNSTNSAKVLISGLVAFLMINYEGRILSPPSVKVSPELVNNVLLTRLPNMLDYYENFKWQSSKLLRVDWDKFQQAGFLFENNSVAETAPEGELTEEEEEKVCNESPVALLARIESVEAARILVVRDRKKYLSTQAEELEKLVSKKKQEIEANEKMTQRYAGLLQQAEKNVSMLEKLESMRQMLIRQGDLAENSTLEDVIKHLESKSK